MFKHFHPRRQNATYKTINVENTESNHIPRIIHNLNLNYEFLLGFESGLHILINMRIEKNLNNLYSLQFPIFKCNHKYLGIIQMYLFNYKM